jgi:hypothetical protein
LNRQNPYVIEHGNKTPTRIPRLNDVPTIVEISPGVFTYPANSR